MKVTAHNHAIINFNLTLLNINFIKLIFQLMYIITYTSHILRSFYLVSKNTINRKRINQNFVICELCTWSSEEWMFNWYGTSKKKPLLLVYTNLKLLIILDYAGIKYWPPFMRLCYTHFSFPKKEHNSLRQQDVL